MEKNKIQLTEAGLKKLQDERANLIEVERAKNIEELQLARSQGDLSENADYDAARERQAQIESRIQEIEYMLNNYTLIEANTYGILDLSKKNAEIEVYTIVGASETDPFSGKISNESPLAKALIGNNVGDIVTVGVAKPYDVEIKSIDFQTKKN